MSAAPLGSVALRADFPALQQEIHGKPLVYLDNAATTHKPQAVLDALDQFHRRDNSNVHRGVHTLSQRATDSYEGARAKIAQFLSVKTDEIIFVRGATEGINLIANAFLRPRLQPGDEVLITAMEHHANIVPWQLACDQPNRGKRPFLSGTAPYGSSATVSPSPQVTLASNSRASISS